MSVTLQDLVYFGTVWFVYENDPEAPLFQLGGGYANASTIELGDGAFFAGVVEKTGANGRVTDVVLSFAGAQTVEDLLTGYALQYGVTAEQSTRAAEIYQSLLDDPRYADATIHVTGHSLGAGLSQYVLGYSLATHGDAFTSARADFTGFGVPAHGEGVANHFGLALSAFDGHFTGYTAANDPVAFPPGAGRIGVQHYLEAYQPLGDLGLLLNGVAAHMQPTYIAALGLPSWLGSDQALVENYVISQQKLPLIDADYGSAGFVDLAIVGDGAANHLSGMGGDDRLVGAGGRDTLTGGAGADSFIFRDAAESGATAATADRITDFSSAEGDRIDLTAIAASLSPLGGTLQWIGSAPFSLPGQVRSYKSGGNTFVALNLDWDSQPETLIRLDGNHDLTAADFLLQHIGPPVTLDPIIDLLGLG